MVAPPVERAQGRHHGFSGFEKVHTTFGELVCQYLTILEDIPILNALYSTN